MLNMGQGCLTRKSDFDFWICKFLEQRMHVAAGGGRGLFFCLFLFLLFCFVLLLFNSILMERLIQQSFNFGVDQNHSGKVCKNRGLAFITVHQAGPLDSFYSFQGDFNCTKVWQPLDDYIVR